MPLEKHAIAAAAVADAYFEKIRCSGLYPVHCHPGDGRRFFYLQMRFKVFAVFDGMNKTLFNQHLSTVTPERYFDVQSIFLTTCPCELTP